MELVAFDPADFIHVASVVEVWNAACPPELAITPRAVTFNTGQVTGSAAAGRLAVAEGRVLGCTLARTLPDGARGRQREAGSIELIAVRPEQQRQGVGAALLAWAEEWLQAQGPGIMRLGAGVRPFVPGLPDRLNAGSFFRSRGYEDGGKLEWDVARDLAGYTTPDVRQASPGAPCEVRPARAGDEGALLAFLEREYRGRWSFEYQEALRSGSRISDYAILLTGRGVDGFAHLTFEDSYWPLDRVFPWRLPRPWAQLGPLGVSWDLRGQGYGGSLMDGALRYLRDSGLRGCVIDWTDLVDFYGKFGFEPYNKYVMLQKLA